MDTLQHRYEILRELGRGASGTVYLAQDSFADRQVALKIAHAHIFSDDPEQRQVRKAWLNEVRQAGSLQHPYIVQVHDAGAGERSAYLVMEYLPGGTLEPYTRPGQLKPVGEVLELAYKCASALDYACRAGIVHRDIKPANLQYLGPGEVKVGDFGAAYWGRGDSTQVMDIGSLAYMAPELFRHWVTPQADIYALGVVLFQLLTGRLPYQADSPAALMYQIIHGEHPRLGELRPELPAAVDELVEEMLARDLEQRFASWPLVQAALSALMPGTVAADGEIPSQGELFEQLRRLPLLQELGDPELWELLRFARWRRAPAGTVLITEGAAARSCYLLLQGETRVTQRGRLINLLTGGTLFGELAFAEATPGARAATITAMTPVVYGKWAYSRLNRASPELRSGMLKIFFRLAAERLKQADEQYQLLYRRLQEQGGA